MPRTNGQLLLAERARAWKKSLHLLATQDYYLDPCLPSFDSAPEMSGPQEIQRPSTLNTRLGTLRPEHCFFFPFSTQKSQVVESPIRAHWMERKSMGHNWVSVPLGSNLLHPQNERQMKPRGDSVICFFQACWIGSLPLVLFRHYACRKDWFEHHLEVLRSNDKSWTAAGPRLVELITSSTVMAPPVMKDRTA
ncbi:uncharacterized protein P174DRAFT_81608 [Aspergillus novofumigatus IBT 16806]|uniref:Uncharacterized protein n=1 Tax=Aspergillus novofumigatus (strain IBT 16806) TaxID=1392255 RepID=A0A2I1CG41_ASPN1|nr:uncharacterized protein P174DRAFT_81608 [Aspergillus novofumigatus IBT 16806]PKX96571.1 hypothetical protein P174DRAFT_81608 [Aspergillus novofumigatus IBT 16806]